MWRAGREPGVSALREVLRVRASFRGYDRAGALQASDAPLLVIDTDLVIRDMNPEYLRVTGRTREELLEAPLFAAFPDNPDDPEADGAANLSASFERVFSGGCRDHMPLQRYDIPVCGAAAFARRYWVLVNSPLHDGSGRLIGAVIHAEDVTSAVDLLRCSGFLSPAAVVTDPGTWSGLVAALAREALGHQEARKIAGQLQQALTSRVVIEQAKGMIAARKGVSVDEAFGRLRRYAREHGAVLSEVARAVVELELPV